MVKLARSGKGIKMIYVLLVLVVALFIYALLLQIKLHEMTELVQESNILTATEETRLKQSYYLKFNKIFYIFII